MAGIKPLRRKDPAAELVAAVRELQEHAEQLDRIGILNGQLVTGVIPSGGTVVLIRHSLGRPYLAGLLVGVSHTEPVQIQTPAWAIKGGARIEQEVVAFTAAAVGQDTDVNVWVY